MKKTYLNSFCARCLTLLVLALLSTNLAWGETYTISFAKGTTNGTNISTQLNSQATTTICSSGGDNISSYSSTNCYYNTNGCGLRLAKSGGAGSLTLTFSDGIQSATIKEVIIYASAVASGNTLDVTPAGTVTTKTTFNSLSTYSTQAEINTYAQTAISINGTLTSLTFGAISKKYVHLHQIDIVTSSTPSTEPTLSVSPATIDFGEVYQNAEVDAEEVTVTFANLTTNDVTAAISGSAFGINKTGSFTSGDKITITPNTANLGEYSETLTVSATGVDEQKVTVTMNVVEAPVMKNYTLVTNASTLKAGDIIVIGSGAKGKVAGAISGEVLSEVDATVKDGILSSSDAMEFTLGGEEGAWTLTSTEGTLGATAVKKLAYGSGTTTWTISIAEGGDATISSTNDNYGRFLHNVGSTRFTTYTSNTSVSMLLPQIYRKEAKVTITSAKYATLGLPYAVTIPNGVSAYTATVSESTVTMTKIKTDVIPANCGVILYAETPKTYTFTETTDVDAITGNQLVAVVSGPYTCGDDYGKDYYLGKDNDGKATFKKLNLGGTIAAGKAYLKLNAALDAGAKLDVTFGEPTGITSYENDNDNENLKAMTVYNLNGMKVNEAYKGIVIMNGKKYINK